MFANLCDPDVFRTVRDGLVGLVGEDGVSIDAQALLDRSRCSLGGELIHGGAAANILVFPTSTADVSGIVKLAGTHRVPLIPYGGGTSLEGNATAPHGGICLDFARMAAILSVRASQMDVTVQPGVEWTRLNRELAPHGLFFPLDPAVGAKIGGMIATGCSGTNAARYGTMKDGWVLSMTVVLPDGSVVRTKGRAKKSSSGYDLTRLMIGSEGTLGITTEATLRLANIPAVSRAASCAFDNLQDVVDVAGQILRRGVDFQCIEFVDEVYIGHYEDVHQSDPGVLHFPAKPHLFVKLMGSSAESVETDGKILEALCAKGQGFRFAAAGKETDELWLVRKTLPIFFGRDLRTEKVPCAVPTDVCVPRDNLVELFVAHRKDLESRGLRAAIMGHLGDGNLHSQILFDKADPQGLDRAEAAHEALIKKAVELDGTITGEHGVGIGKAPYMVAEHGTRVMQLMKDIKMAIDPMGIFNPGQIFPPE